MRILKLSILLSTFVWLAPASAQLSGGMMFPGPGTPATAGGGRTCTDTASANFLARTGGSAPNYGAGSTNYADAICNLIKGLEADGLITGTLGGAASCGTLLDGLYLLKSSTSANSLLNICGTSYSLVNHGTSFTANVGYTGASSSYVDTQFDPTAVSGQNWSQNSATFGAYSATTISSDVSSMGGNGSGTLVSRLYPYFGGQAFLAG